MKEQILKLRNEGKTYKEIKDELGCSKGTISYYCGVDGHKKVIDRNQKNRKKNPLKDKVDKYKYRSSIRKKTRDFGRRINGTGSGKLQPTSTNDFNVDDLLNKFGPTTKCYLTGTDINLSDTEKYAFDHYIPSSRGGENTLENLRICRTDVNKSKSDMLFEEYINLCKTVLEHNGYSVNKTGGERGIRTPGAF